MTLFLNGIIYILKQFGVIAIISGIFSWIFYRISERLNLKWKNKYDKEIERIKSGLINENEMYKNSLSLFNSQNQFSQERRLKSIEILWENIIKLRQYGNPLISFYSVLLPSEYNDNIEKIMKSLNLQSLSNERSMELSIETDCVEMQRPFLNEELWSLFYTYRAFILRNIYIFLSGVDKGNIKPWYQDSNLVNFLNLSLGNEVVSKINSKSIGSLSEAVTLLEQKIILKCTEITSGEFASEAGFKQARNLIDAVEKEKAEKALTK